MLSQVPRVGCRYIRTSNVVYCIADTTVKLNIAVTCFPIMLCSPQTKNRQNMEDRNLLNAICCKEKSVYNCGISNRQFTCCHYNSATPWEKSTRVCIPIYTDGITSLQRLVRWRWDFNWLLQWVTEPLRFYSPLPHRRHWLAFAFILIMVLVILMFYPANSSASKQHPACTMNKDFLVKNVLKRAGAVKLFAQFQVLNKYCRALSVQAEILILINVN